VSDGCRLCVRESGDDPIFRDSLWSLWRLGDAPGWTMLTLRRHAVGIWSLTEAELESLGLTLDRVSRAIRSATDAEKVYVHLMAESEPHFHLVLLPRGPEVPHEHRGPNLFVNRRAYGGRAEQAAEVAALIGRELASPRGSPASPARGFRSSRGIPP
jgi:diadenosine tetraphosphate (Ap4A) HIT family hydrolase